MNTLIGYPARSWHLFKTVPKAENAEFYHKTSHSNLTTFYKMNSSVQNLTISKRWKKLSQMISVLGDITTKCYAKSWIGPCTKKSILVE